MAVTSNSGHGVFQWERCRPGCLLCWGWMKQVCARTLSSAVLRMNHNSLIVQEPCQVWADHSPHAPGYPEKPPQPPLPVSTFTQPRGLSFWRKWGGRWWWVFFSFFPKLSISCVNEADMYLGVPGTCPSSPELEEEGYSM